MGGEGGRGEERIIITNDNIYNSRTLNNGQVGASTLVHYSEVVLYWGV